MGRFFGSRFFWAVPAALFLVGGWLVLPSFLDLVRTGATYEHWSRFIVMSTMFSCALILLVSKLIEYSLLLMAAQLSDMAASARRGDAPPPSAGAPS